MAQPVDVGEANAPSATLEADIAALVNVGLQPCDIERIYHAVHGVDAEAVKEACRRLIGSRMVPELGRQVSVGLALLNGSGAATPSDVDAVVKSLQEELNDNPPERFKDPISFSLMSDPQVISSGYVFDKSTLFDARGRLRLMECPMTRQELKPFVFPLNFLKHEIIEWKLRRFDAVVSAAQKLQRPPSASSTPMAPVARESINALLKVADALLSSLDASTYHHRVLALWRLKRRNISNDTAHSERRAMLMALQAAARGRGVDADLEALLEEFMAECVAAGVDVTPEPTPIAETISVETISNIGEWVVRWESGDRKSIVVRGGGFVIFGTPYELRDTEPLSFVWGDGTVQTLDSFDGHTITWTTNHQRFPYIYWDAGDDDEHDDYEDSD